MGFDTYGAPQFGLADVKIAPWTSTGAYGTVVDVPSVQMMATTLKVQSAQLEGDDAIQASASRAIGGEVRFRFGSISIAALEVMLGQNAVPSGSPESQQHLRISGGDRMPYFGICGKALAEEGEGDTHVFLPKCKIMGDVTIAQLQYGQFAIPEMTVQAVHDDTYGAINIIEHAADTAVAIPPVGI